MLRKTRCLSKTGQGKKPWFFLEKRRVTEGNRASDLFRCFCWVHFSARSHKFPSWKNTRTYRLVIENRGLNKQKIKLVGLSLELMMWVIRLSFYIFPEPWLDPRINPHDSKKLLAKIKSLPLTQWSSTREPGHLAGSVRTKTVRKSNGIGNQLSAVKSSICT